MPCYALENVKPSPYSCTVQHPFKTPMIRSQTLSCFVFFLFFSFPLFFPPCFSPLVPFRAPFYSLPWLASAVTCHPSILRLKVEAQVQVQAHDLSPRRKLPPLLPPSLLFPPPGK